MVWPSIKSQGPGGQTGSRLSCEWSLVWHLSGVEEGFSSFFCELKKPSKVSSLYVDVIMLHGFIHVWELIRGYALSIGCTLYVNSIEIKFSKNGNMFLCPVVSSCPWRCLSWDSVATCQKWCSGASHSRRETALPPWVRVSVVSAQVLPFSVEVFIDTFDLKHFNLSWFLNVLKCTGVRHGAVKSFTAPQCISQMEQFYGRSSHIVLLFLKHNNLCLLDQGRLTPKTDLSVLSWIFKEYKLERLFGLILFFSIKPHMTHKCLFGCFSSWKVDSFGE